MQKNRPAARSAAAVTALVALCAGCQPSGNPLPDEITFSEHVAPLVQAKCAPCHRAGGSAPFKLVDYDDVERRAVEVSQVVRSGYMPPWLPEAGPLAFVGDRSLTDREVELIRLWVKQGAREGDPDKLPQTPEWPAGWLLGEPDLIVELPEYELGPDGLDVFRNLVVRAPVERTRWVAAVELRPGNKRVVHHALLQLDSAQLRIDRLQLRRWATISPPTRVHAVRHTFRKKGLGAAPCFCPCRRMLVHFVGSLGE